METIRLDGSNGGSDCLDVRAGREILVPREL